MKGSKKITVNITFCYKVTEPGKRGRVGATANQQAELDARTPTIGRGACIRKAYTLMRCLGPPCTKGDHCWQNEGRYYRLQPHHVRLLAEYLQQGKPLEGHDDVPEEYRRLVKADDRQWDERQRKQQERQRRRKRRRRCSDASSASSVHDKPSTPVINFPTSPLIGLICLETI